MKIILFDLDRTLFDTDWYYEQIVDLIEGNTELSEEAIRSFILEYRANNRYGKWFNFLKFIDDVVENDTTKKEIVDTLKTDVSMYRLFEDVELNLEQLQGLGYKMGVYSEGVPWFQELKLQNTCLLDFLDTELVFITEMKRAIEFLDTLPESCVIVDDTPEVIEVLEKDGRFVPVWLNRKGVEWKYGREIGGLGELVDILAKPC